MTGGARGWVGAAGRGGCHGQPSLVVESSVDVPAHAATSPRGLCRCVPGDPEPKINRGEFRTGIEIDDQASGEPRGAPQGEATQCSLAGGAQAPGAGRLRHAVAAMGFILASIFVFSGSLSDNFDLR